MEVTGHTSASMFKRYADLWREEQIAATMAQAGALAN